MGDRTKGLLLQRFQAYCSRAAIHEPQSTRFSSWIVARGLRPYICYGRNARAATIHEVVYFLQQSMSCRNPRGRMIHLVDCCSSWIYLAIVITTTFNSKLMLQQVAKLLTGVVNKMLKLNLQLPFRQSCSCSRQIHFGKIYMSHCIHVTDGMLV